MNFLKIFLKIIITILGLFLIFTDNQEILLKVFIIITILYLILDSTLDFKK